MTQNRTFIADSHSSLIQKIEKAQSIQAVLFEDLTHLLSDLSYDSQDFFHEEKGLENLKEKEKFQTFFLHVLKADQQRLFLLKFCEVYCLSRKKITLQACGINSLFSGQMKECDTLFLLQILKAFSELLHQICIKKERENIQIVLQTLQAFSTAYQEKLAKSLKKLTTDTLSSEESQLWKEIIRTDQQNKVLELLMRYKFPCFHLLKHPSCFEILRDRQSITMNRQGSFWHRWRQYLRKRRFRYMFNRLIHHFKKDCLRRSKQYILKEKIISWIKNPELSWQTITILLMAIRTKTKNGSQERRLCDLFLSLQKSHQSSKKQPLWKNIERQLDQQAAQQIKNDLERQKWIQQQLFQLRVQVISFVEETINNPIESKIISLFQLKVQEALHKVHKNLSTEIHQQSFTKILSQCSAGRPKKIDQSRPQYRGLIKWSLNIPLCIFSLPQATAQYRMYRL